MTELIQATQTLSLPGAIVLTALILVVGWVAVTYLRGMFK